MIIFSPFFKIFRFLATLQARSTISVEEEISSITSIKVPQVKAFCRATLVLVVKPIRVTSGHIRATRRIDLPDWEKVAIQLQLAMLATSNAAVAIASVEVLV